MGEYNIIFWSGVVNAESVVWFRAGYPLLFKEVIWNVKLKRKAKKSVSDEGLKNL